MSIKFPPVILGPEMAAPILWAPGKCVLPELRRQNPLNLELGCKSDPDLNPGICKCALVLLPKGYLRDMTVWK